MFIYEYAFLSIYTDVDMHIYPICEGILFWLQRVRSMWNWRRRSGSEADTSHSPFECRLETYFVVESTCIF